MSYGAIPYGGLSNVEVMERVIAGHQLIQPDNCPDRIYELMTICWNIDPLRRPNFREIFTIVDEVRQELTENENCSQIVEDHELEQKRVVDFEQPANASTKLYN